MRALQLTGWQRAAELRDVADPEPGPGQVLVRIGGAGACRSDLHIMHDFPAGALPFELPFTLGHENAGWVEAVGAGVHGIDVGQPVAVYGPSGCGVCRSCREGFENYCDHQAERAAMAPGLGTDGGMARLMVVSDSRHLVPLRDLHPVDAAPLTDAALTPYHAIKRSLGVLGPGSFAVVIGAGGLGHLAVQILDALSPATIVAVDERDEALHLAHDVGADHGVVAGPSAAVEVRELTRGRGADLVLDLVGVDASLALAVATVRPRAHVTLVGIGGGTYGFGYFTVPYEVSLTSTYWGSLPELAEVLELAEAGKIRAHVQRYPLDDAPTAYDDMAAGRLRGRAVIVPD